MSKKQYKLNVSLSYPTDIKIIKRLATGENVAPEERNEKRAEAGSIVDDLPVSSVPFLLASGKITPINDEEITLVVDE